MVVRAELDALITLYDNPETANPDTCQVTDALTRLATCGDPQIARVAEEARQFWAAWGATDQVQCPRLSEYRWHGFFTRMETLREIRMAEREARPLVEPALESA